MTPRELRNKWQKKHNRLAEKEDPKSITEANVIEEFLADIEGIRIDETEEDKENREVIRSAVEGIKKRNKLKEKGGLSELNRERTESN